MALIQGGFARDARQKREWLSQMLTGRNSALDYLNCANIGNKTYQGQFKRDISIMELGLLTVVASVPVKERFAMAQAIMDWVDDNAFYESARSQALKDALLRLQLGFTLEAAIQDSPYTQLLPNGDVNCLQNWADFKQLFVAVKPDGYQTLRGRVRNTKARRKESA
jgi:hypothetical protein